MRAVTFDGQVHYTTNAPIPEPNEHESLIRITKAGICNTDLEVFAGYLNFRGIPGHEFVGRVEAGAPEWMGRRVVGEINVVCGKCDMCLRGIPSQCRDRKAIGINRHDGAFADYLALPNRNLHAVPDDVTNEQAVFVEPLAAALQTLEAVHITPRDNVVLIGAGKLGLLTAQVMKLTGCDLSVVVRREKPAMLLNRWGIRAVTFDELPENRAQVVIDCTGNEEGFGAALDLVEPRGAILLKSTYTALPTANLTKVAVNELRVIGSRCGPFDAALRLLQAGLIDVESMIDARLPLDDSLEGFRQAAEPGALKVLLEVGD